MGARETLAAVKGMGLKTALVSNAGLTSAPHLSWILDNYGLSSYLDVSVFSDELQIAKPDPRIFQAALDKLDVAAADTVFVGDTPHNDVWGAQAAGIFAVQIGGLTRDGVVPQARIERLEELIGVLRANGSPAPA